MLSRRAALVVLALLAPTLVPTASAEHPPPAEFATFLAGWLAEADAALANSTIPPADRSPIEQLRLQANRSASRSLLTEGAVQIALYGGVAEFFAARVAGPGDENAEAQRRDFLNVSADWAVKARENLTAGRGELKAFTPGSAQGLERAILAGRILVAAESTLAEDYERARTTVLKSPNPDPYVTSYRTAVMAMFSDTAGVVRLVEAARDVLAAARAADATGATLLNAAGRDGVVAAYAAEAKNPGFRGLSPDQAPIAARADAAFDAGEWQMGLATFLFFDEVRTYRGYEGARDSGSLTAEELATRQRAAARAVELALNETAANGWPGLILRAGAAFAAGTSDPLSSVARLEAARNMHNGLLPMAGATDAPADRTGLILVAIGGGLVVLAAFIFLRRRG